MNGKWQSVVLDMMSQAKKFLRNSKDGVLIVDVRVFLDSDGNPIVWHNISQPQKVKPSNVAKQAVETIMLPRLDEDA